MFTVRRKGEFTAYLVPGTPHCGIGEGKTKTFTYDAWVCLDDNGLDSRGFVIDNSEFKKYFDGISRLDISCETLCKQAATHLYKMAAVTKPRKKYVTEVCVQIWGLPGEAYAEYKWLKTAHKAA
jgi:hypothetical protein